MLARIEATPGVRRAWISQDGAFVVVLPRPGADVAADVQAALAAERSAVVRLEGTNLETVLALFEAERGDWIRGATHTRELTRTESEIVAARIADRVAARVTLPPRHRAAIEAEVARRFYRAVLSGDEGEGVEGLIRALPELSPEAQAALREAVALGFRPLEGER